MSGEAEGPFDVTSLHGRRAEQRWNRMSVGDVLERVTHSFPEKPALVAWDGACATPDRARMTYRQADALCNRIANALLLEGLQRSDRVLLVCENSVEAFLTKIACAKAGLVAMPVNPAFAPDVMVELITRCDPAFAIVDAELWPGAEQAFAATGLQAAVTIPIGGETIEGSRSFDAFIAEAPDHEPEVSVHGDDIWEILFTSGTTALPKAAMLSHVYTYTSAYAHALTLTRGVRVECNAVIANFLPMIYHVSGHVLPFAAWLSGGTFVIGRRYDAVAQATAIHREGVTALLGGMSMMVEALADELEDESAGHDARSLRVLLYVWSQISPQTVERYKRLCGEELSAVEIFGQTESISNHRFWADKWPDVHRRHAPASNYVGVPCPILASVVADPESDTVDPVAPGVPGEVLYRSPAMTAGYFRDPEATAEAFRGGWFHSGDSCVVDDEGLRVMIDRYKDVVKTGGENVSSLRVEAVVNQHPGVLQAAVVGLPHERWGEAVTAFAVRADGSSCTEAEIVAHCRSRLTAFERPKRVIFVDALPQTVGGKVMKHRLREQHQHVYD